MYKGERGESGRRGAMGPGGDKGDSGDIGLPGLQVRVQPRYRISYVHDILLRKLLIFQVREVLPSNLIIYIRQIKNGI